MQKHFACALSLCILLVCLLALPALQAANPSNRQTDVIQTSRGDLRLTPLYHGSVMLQFGGNAIHVDPWSSAYYPDLPLADLMVVTHTHGIIWIGR